VKRGPLVALAALGLALSLVLEWLHVKAYVDPDAASFCTLGTRVDCTTVALSRHSVILGIPVPLLGALGFLALGLSALVRSRLLVLLAALGALASLVLLGVELVAIGAVCMLCEAVHVLTFVIAALAFRAWPMLSPIERERALVVLSPPVGIGIALVLFLPPYWGAFGWREVPPYPEGKTADGAPWIGAREPTLVVDEYTDYACPHCRVAAARALRYLAEHPNGLRIVRHQYPRMPCPVGVRAACQAVRVAYCAEAQGKFWQMDRFLLEHAAGGHVDVAAAAQAVGLDQRRLAACVEHTDTYMRAERESKQSAKKRILGTPHYEIGGKRLSMKEATRRMAEAH